MTEQYFSFYAKKILRDYNFLIFLFSSIAPLVPLCIEEMIYTLNNKLIQKNHTCHYIIVFFVIGELDEKLDMKISIRMLLWITLDNYRSRRQIISSQTTYSMELLISNIRLPFESNFDIRLNSKYLKYVILMRWQLARL